MLLESSQWGLQLCFIPHFNWKFAHKIMGSKVLGVPILGIPGLQLVSLKTKWHLDAGPVARHIEYYKGEGGGFPQVWAMVSLMSPFGHGSFMHQKCFNYALTNLLFGLCMFVWIIDLLISLLSPHPKARAHPFTPKCYELKSVPQLLILLLFSLFGFTIVSIKEFGGVSLILTRWCCSIRLMNCFWNNDI